ncbi:MAG TPA: hypothetical protein VNF73_05130 [Candidatus Saccharimonadales bacterium]|nr:hypothetical protein [Candidatus Saccharimonadales bacterium]
MERPGARVVAVNDDVVPLARADAEGDVVEAAMSPNPLLRSVDA